MMNTQYNSPYLVQHSQIGVSCELQEQNKEQAIVILRLVAELPELFKNIKLQSDNDQCQELISIGNNIREIARGAREVLTETN